MNTGRLKHIRKEEKKYHEKYYSSRSLYQKGSWLEGPEKVIMELLTRLNLKEPKRVLDLGCGVGRNGIPIAKKVKAGGGCVICVDLLEKALDELKKYSEKYKVNEIITLEQFDIGDYPFPETAEYDYIVAASSLEHLKSEATLKRTLDSLVRSTKNSGINFISMNTNIEEVTLSTGTKRQPLFEILMSQEEALALLRQHYYEWEELYVSSEPLELQITRDDVPVMLKADNLTFAVCKPR